MIHDLCPQTAHNLVVSANDRVRCVYMQQEKQTKAVKSIYTALPWLTDSWVITCCRLRIISTFSFNSWSSKVSTNF